MTNWQLAILTLLALVVGALVPLLLQVRCTLQRLEAQLTSEKLENTLREARLAVRGLRMVGRQLESKEREIKDLMAAMRDLSDILREARRAVKVAHAAGAAVGPALVAAARSLRGIPSTKKLVTRPSAS